MGVTTSGGGRANPIHFERAMVFIDGTNLFQRLAAAKLRVPRFAAFLPYFLGGRQLIRAYLYSIEQTVAKAKAIHGDTCFEGVRVVLGEGIPKADGNIKEKGVDALLVADLVYHAATRNYDYALVVSHDTDFVQGLRRVEDFGCRTAVLGLGGGLPTRLKEASDFSFEPELELLISNHWAIPL